MTSEFDAILSSAQGPEFLAQITRLYQVVQGRPPDPEGLRTYVGHLGRGTSLRDLAEALLTSDEFKRQCGTSIAEEFLCRNAFGETWAEHSRWAGNMSCCDLAVTLVTSPEVARCLPVLPALYPDGLLLEQPTDYRIWLAGRPLMSMVGVKPPPVSFIMVLLEPATEAAIATLGSVLALNWPGLEMVVCASRFGRTLHQVAALDERVRLLRRPSWHGAGRRFDHGLARCTGEFAALIAAAEHLDLRNAPAIAASPGRCGYLIIGRRFG